MTRPDPAAVFDGTRTGYICDRCNRGVRTGEVVQAYETASESDGWTLRRLWGEACSSTSLDRETDGADAVTIETIVWTYCLASVEITARSRPADESQ